MSHKDRVLRRCESINDLRAHYSHDIKEKLLFNNYSSTCDDNPYYPTANNILVEQRFLLFKNTCKNIALFRLHNWYLYNMYSFIKSNQSLNLDDHNLSVTNNSIWHLATCSAASRNCRGSPAERSYSTRL